MNLRNLALPLAAVALGGCGPVDVQLAPPKAGQGFQLKVDPYDVPKSTETQRCYFFEVNSDSPVFVHKFEVAQNPGTHHMNIFRVKTIKGLYGSPGDSVIDGECWKSANWSDWPLVVNSQESNQDKPNPDNPAKQGYMSWTMPDGVAMRFEPHELIMLMSHYVNAMAQVGLVIRRMEEPRPPDGFLAKAKEYRDAADIPRLLLLLAERLVT